MAEAESSDNLPQHYIPEDLLRIRQRTKTVIHEFTDYLAQKKIPDPEQTAQEWLLLGKKPPLDGPDGDDVNDEAERLRKLIPTFLFVMAVTEPAGSMKRENEIKEMTSGRSNFLECVMEIDPRISDLRQDPVVESYDEMLQQIQSFFDDTSAVKRSNLPIIVFLGPVSDCEFCFSDENTWPHVIRALEDIRSRFEARRLADMPSCQLRVIFSQCHAHLYLTSQSLPINIVIVTKRPDISLLKKLNVYTDVELHFDHFFWSAVRKPTQDLAKDPDFTRFSHDQIKRFIIDGPTDHLSENIKNKIQQQRRKMRMCLQIICPSTHEFEDHLDKLRTELGIPVGDEYTKMVQSKEEIHKAIDRFLLVDAEDVYMPVIIVTADGEIDDAGQFMLHIDEGNPVNCQRILDDHRKKKSNLRLIILLNDGTSHVWVTNAVPPEIVYPEMPKPQQYTYVIIEECQHNTTEIQPPEGERGSRCNKMAAAESDGNKMEEAESGGNKMAEAESDGNKIEEAESDGNKIEEAESDGNKMAEAESGGNKMARAESDGNKMAEAESGGNKMAEAESGGKRPQHYIPEDLLKIRQRIKAVIQEFTDYLAQKKISDPEQRALELLLLGKKPPLDGPDGDDVNDEAERLQKLIPTFLFIMAVTEPAGSMKRENEIKRLMYERSNFLKCVMEIDPRISDLREDPVVESYAKMLQQIQSFFDDTSAVKRSNLPIIVFLGHGSKDGKLCFSEKTLPPHLKRALEDIRRRFEARRPVNVPSCQLRVIFSQCQAHLIDNSPHTPGEIRYDRTEHMYFTSPSSPINDAKADVTLHISLLENLTFHSDVALEVDGSDEFFTSAVSQLREDLAGDPDFTQYSHDEIKCFIIDGPPDHLSENIQNKIQQQRRKIRMCLQIICPSTQESEERLADLKRHLDITVDDEYTKTVQSKEEFHEMIDSFLFDDAEDVYMPVIIVTADGEIDDAGQFMLHINQGTPVDAQTTLDDYREENFNLRLIILLHDGTSHVLVTNSVPPEIHDSKRTVLHEYAYVIIGDSPHNKTGIQPPEVKRRHRNDAE